MNTTQPLALVALIVAIGALAFGLLTYLEETSEEPLTRADVQSMIDSRTSELLTRAEVRAMITSQAEAHFEGEAYLADRIIINFFALQDFAICADWQLGVWIAESFERGFGLSSARSSRISDAAWESAIEKCRDEAVKASSEN